MDTLTHFITNFHCSRGGDDKIYVFFLLTKLASWDIICPHKNIFILIEYEKYELVGVNSATAKSTVLQTLLTTITDYVENKRNMERDI